MKNFDFLNFQKNRINYLWNFSFEAFPRPSENQKNSDNHEIN